MEINFENYGRFYCSLAYVNNDVIDYRASNPHTLKECANFIENRMSICNTIVLGIICDFDTGEVVATIEHEQEPDNDWDYNEDMGFDPYMGCYTDDC